MAIAELSLKKIELEETRSKVQRESKMLLYFTQKAIAQLTYWIRWYLYAFCMYV
jgi:HAUS augmin-like complex subunit 1